MGGEAGELECVCVCGSVYVKELVKKLNRAMESDVRSDRLTVLIDRCGDAFLAA